MVVSFLLLVLCIKLCINFDATADPLPILEVVSDYD
jgi:hypothetical protein